jgi:hypothetical protein
VRLTKASTTGLVVVAVLLTAGTGFAAFTAQAFVNGNATAGTLGPLVWNPGPTSSGFGGGACSVVRGETTLPDDTLFITAGNLAPGASCTYGDALTNEGSLPATVSGTITSATGTLCTALYYGDTFFSTSIPIGAGGQTGPTTVGIGAHAEINWAGTITLPSDTSSAYLGDTCDFTVTVTATAGT